MADTDNTFPPQHDTTPNFGGHGGVAPEVAAPTASVGIGNSATQTATADTKASTISDAK